MPELEAKIAAWRKNVSGVLPGQEETIQELEEHLRDQVEASMRRGLNLEAAFTDALVRLGDAEVIATEFHRLTPSMSRGWWPERIVQIVMVLVPVAVVALLFGKLLNGKMTFLLFSHVVLITTGYLAALTGGALGLGCAVASYFQNASERQCRDSSRVILTLTVITTILVPIGFILGAIWAKRSLGHYWLADPKEVGAALIMVWSVAALIAGRRVAGDSRLVWLMAVLGGIVTLLAWPGAGLGLLGSGGQVAWFALSIVASWLVNRRQLRPE